MFNIITLADYGGELLLLLLFPFRFVSFRVFFFTFFFVGVFNGRGTQNYTKLSSNKEIVWHLCGSLHEDKWIFLKIPLVYKPLLLLHAAAPAAAAVVAALLRRCHGVSREDLLILIITRAPNGRFWIM